MNVQVPTRPVQPDDEARFVRLWPRLSPETVYRRFHSPVRALPMAQVRRFVQVDHDLREAVVAVVGDEVVGVARYDRAPEDPSTAEVAVLVEDAWQGVGVGRQLLSEVLELARAHGVATIGATVQADNERMLWLLRRLLPCATLTVDAAVYDVAASLPCPAAAPTVASAHEIAAVSAHH
jgi:GNAT superfamily N-acetyltransferase